MPSKGNIPWNKGRKETRVEVLKRQSDSHKGQHSSIATQFKKGQISHKKGIFVSTEVPVMHYWIEQILGQPKYCEHCKKSDRKIYDWANKDHTYKRLKEDWMRLCRSCHLKYDYKYNGRKNYFRFLKVSEANNTPPTV